MSRALVFVALVLGLTVDPLLLLVVGIIGVGLLWRER